MEVILGPFHPHLEDALVEEITRFKAGAPLDPVLVLVPSNSLRRRLKVLLARERGFDLLSLHILTFYQLSLRLVEERHGSAAPLLRDSALLEEILRQILRLGLPGAAPFASLEEKAGGPAALWQTLRDLKDGAVDPATALEAARGDLFEESTAGVQPLLTLFETFLAGTKNWGLNDYADLDMMALEQVPASAYLKQFERVLYYGFYDLTQVQLDIFQAVARAYPTTLFFPLVHEQPKNPAWTFAERFYERYVHGMAAGAARVRNLVSPGPTAEHAPLLPLFAGDKGRPRRADVDGLGITCMSCFSPREEIDAAAKEILRLVTEEGYSFDQIGVVGRALEIHRPWVKEIFSRHAIPFVTSAAAPLAQHPLAKAALLLANLPLKGYLRSHVVDLLDSPFFNHGALAPDGAGPRPDLWDLATRLAGVGKGIEEWRRLEKYLARGIVAAERGDEEGERRSVVVPAGEVRALGDLFGALSGAIEALPKEARWSRYVESWGALQNKWLRLDADSGAGPEAEEIGKVLERLAALDAVSESVTLAHFLETYQHWLERASVAPAETNAAGVAVLDAMAARGMSFRALFIVGLNEGIFPRTIREDAFLRDRERELLETVLGYKVATKLGGFDEERLLFTLLVGSAKERLYCLHQRNDDAGRPLAPSWYLDELARAAGADRIETVVVPRAEAEKSALAPYDRIGLLPPEELALRLIFSSRDAAPLVHLSLPGPSLYDRGAAALRRLETISDQAAEYDGVVGPVADYWARVAAKGLSPTALEAYARCPFQFFARNLLGLERLERPEDVAGPGGADMGQIVHAILGAFYQELVGRKYFTAGAPSVNIQSILSAVTKKAFIDFERDNPVGYPLDWEIRCEEIALLLDRAVAADLAELAGSGFAPIAMESDATVRLPDSWPAPLGGLTIRGRMDRIDYQAKENRYRVVDYKLKSQKTRRPEDKDLLRSALRGQRLQPPFYLLLAERQAERFNGPAAAIDAAFYFLAPKWPDGPLVVEGVDGGVWDGPSGASLKRTVAFLADALARGLFFIQPADHCRYCEVSEACRKNHRPTMWRVERDPRSIAHEALKNKKAESA